MIAFQFFNAALVRSPHRISVSHQKIRKARDM
jgi:hypothetical protein